MIAIDFVAPSSLLKKKIVVAESHQMCYSVFVVVVIGVGEY